MTKELKSVLIGAQIVDIERIFDYFQLRFNNRDILNIFNHSTLDHQSDATICQFVRCTVVDVTFNEKEVKIALSGDKEIIIGLKESDYSGPEALEHIRATGEFIVT